MRRDADSCVVAVVVVAAACECFFSTLCLCFFSHEHISIFLFFVRLGVSRFFPRSPPCPFVSALIVCVWCLCDAYLPYSRQAGKVASAPGCSWMEVAGGDVELTEEGQAQGASDFGTARVVGVALRKKTWYFEVCTMFCMIACKPVNMARRKTSAAGLKCSAGSFDFVRAVVFIQSSFRSLAWPWPC